MKKLTPKPKGFTIIEVIIVLVVGAVIMLAVFVVVPQLQRASRESQMRQAATRVLLAARECINTGCVLPVNLENTQPLRDYTGIIKNPKTNQEYRYYNTTDGPAYFADYMWIMLNTSCSSSNSYNTIGASSGSIAVIYNVEPYQNNPTQDGQRRCVSD